MLLQNPKPSRYFRNMAVHPQFPIPNSQPQRRQAEAFASRRSPLHSTSPMPPPGDVGGTLSASAIAGGTVTGHHMLHIDCYSRSKEELPTASASNLALSAQGVAPGASSTSPMVIIPASRNSYLSPPRPERRPARQGASQVQSARSGWGTGAFTQPYHKGTRFLRRLP
jgi:hypothetical protein